VLHLDDRLLAAGTRALDPDLDLDHAALAGGLGGVLGGRPAANGVLLRAPLKPTVPAEAQEIVSPLVSVIVHDRVVERSP
jgi:hypothetical protein